MSEQYKEAGRFDLLSFKITSYDRSKTFEIKGIVHSFEIHESMKKGAIRGFAKMFDSVGLLQDFPLRGEEFIEIRYKDWYDTEHVDKMFLYAISDVRQPVPNNPSRWEYTIHFTSRPKIYSENIRIRKAFAGPAGNRAQGDLISEFVQTVYDDYYGNRIPGSYHNNSDPAGAGPKPLIVQPTDGRQILVVPNYNPEQAMHFFARRAYSASSFSQTFRFFENRKNYVFATNEYLQREAYSGVYTFTQNFMQNQTPEGQFELQNGIINIDYGEVVNSITGINGGGYIRRTYEMDAMYNVINTVDYNHEQSFYNNNPDQKLYHTPQFINERLNKIDERWVIKDYSSEGMPEGPGVRFNTHYADIYNKKGAHIYHLDQNKTNVTIYGNNEIVAGSTINIQILKHTADDDQENDVERSGDYLVESIENVFYENTYIQKLTITRNGIGNAAL